MACVLDYKDALKGKRCFVLGNGYSLRDAPFDELKREITFACNRIALMFNKTDWRPTYYVMTSTLWGDERLPQGDILKAIDSAKMSFIWDRYKEQLKGRGGVCLLPLNHTGNYKSPVGRVDFWSDNPMGGISKYGTTLFAILQLVAYMNPTEVYVLGADGYKANHNRNEPDPNHFDPNYHPELKGNWVKLANEFAKDIYRIAKINMDRLGIKLYDATQSEGYGVLEKVEIEKVLNG